MTGLLLKLNKEKEDIVELSNSTFNNDTLSPDNF